MEHKIVHMEAFSAVGMLYRGRAAQGEIPWLWQQFGPRMQEIQGTEDECVSYGLSDNMDQASGEFDYLAAMKVRGAGEIPEGMVRWDILAGTYAVFSTTLPMVGDTFDYAYHTWLPRSGYCRAAGPDLEEYGCEFDPNDPLSPFNVYIPLVKQ